MGRLKKNKNSLKKKIVTTSMLVATLIGTAFFGKSFAQELERNVDNYTYFYPIPRYITYEDYINDPYLLCTGHGIGLPGKASTTVTSGKHSTHTTDQGKDTGKLTEGDIGTATCFGDKKYTDLEDTESKTYGYFTKAETFDATPAEAYVLTELEKNKPGDGVEYIETQEEYTGEVDEDSFINVDGTKYYIINGNDSNNSTNSDSEQQYVVKTGEKYYIVEAVNDGGSGDYSAVQVAWWKVSTKNRENGGSPSGGNSLSDEAEAFEAYIKSLNGGNIEYVEGEEELADSIESIKLAHSDYSISVNGSAKIGYSVYPTNVKSQAIVWKTSDEKIAKVNKNGKVTGVSKGKVKITLSLKDNKKISASCIVTVGDVSSDSSDDETSEDENKKILLDRSVIKIKKGSEGVVKISMLPENFSVKAEITHKKVAKFTDGSENKIVDNKIHIKGLKADEETTLTVTAKDDPSVKATCKIKVIGKNDNIGNINVHRIELNKKSLLLEKGASKKLKVTVFPSDATNVTYKYESNKPNIVSVNKNGKVTAKAEGTAKITVSVTTNKTNNNAGTTKTAKCTVTVVKKNSSGSISNKNPKEVEGEYKGEVVSKKKLYKVDYKVTTKAEDAKVLYDAKTNKYKIGPFSTNYTRSAGKFGNRSAVDFAGITGSVLKGKFYIDGQEVIKDISDQYYKIIYTHDHKQYMEDHKDGVIQGDYSDENYEYPYSDEEFYIELDYMNDLTAISDFSFNYHYLNGSGRYTMFTGEYLIIKWKVYEYGLNTTDNSSDSSNNVVTDDLLLGKEDTEESTQKLANNQTEVDIKDILIENAENKDEKKKVEFTDDEGALIYNDNVDIALGEENIVITFSIRDYYSSSFFLTETEYTSTLGDIAREGNTFTVVIPRDYADIYVKDSTDINIKYTYRLPDRPGIPDDYIYPSISATINFEYSNPIDKYLEKISPKMTTSTENANLTKSNVGVIFKREGFLDGSKIKFDCATSSNTKIELKALDYPFPQLPTFTMPQGLPSLPVTDMTVNEKVISFSKSGMKNIRVIISSKNSDYEIKTSLVANVPVFSIDEDNIELEAKASKSVTIYNADGKVPPIIMISGGLNIEKTLTGIEKLNPDTGEATGEQGNTGDGEASAYISSAGLVDEGRKLKIKASSTVLPVNATVDLKISDEGGGLDKITVKYLGGVTEGTDSDSGDGSSPDVLEESGVVAQTSTPKKAQPQSTTGDPDDDDDSTGDPNYDKEDTELETGAAYIIDTEVSAEFLTEDNKKPELDLTTSIGGMVWEDFENFAKGEDTSANGIYNESDGDKKLSKIEVRIWRVVYEKNGDTYTESTSEEYKRTLADAYRTKTVDEKGSVKLENKINFESDKVEDRLFTDDKGDYVAYLTVPAIEGLDTDKYKVSYDVEFIYDGQTYEVTEYLASTLTEEEKEKKKEAKTVEEKVEEFKKTSAIPDGAGADPSTIDYSKYANDSYAIETYTERHDFDASFTQIKGDKEIQSDGTTKGKAEDASANVKELDYTSEDQKFDPDPTGEADATNNGNDESRKASTLVTKNQDGYVKDEFKMKARTSTAGLLLPYEDRIHIEKMKETIPLEYVDTQQEGTFTYYKPVTEYFSHINLGLVTRDTTDVSVTHDLYKAAVTVNNDELTYKYSSLTDYEKQEYADHLNMLLDMQNSGVEYELGLYASDFYYRADVYKPETTVETTKKSVYDALYKEKKNSELRVFATYRFSVYNDSTTQDMNINRLTDYFDDSFTPVQAEIESKVNNADGISEKSVVAEPSYYRIYSLMARSDNNDNNSSTNTSIYKYNKAEDTSIETLNRANSEPMTVGTVTWQVDDTFNKELTKLDGTEEAGKYKKMYTDTFTAKNENGAYTTNELTLHPGEKIEIFVTFEVDNNGYLYATEPREKKEDSLYRGNLLGGKNNVVEVSNYTTFYTDSSLEKNNNVAYKSGEVSGRIDKDSAPDNTNFDMTAVEENNGVKYTVLDKKWFEDDTDSAPVFKIFLRNPADNPRTLDGVVWEDELNKDVDGALNTKTGDGKYEDSEKKIEGVTVSLVEKIKIKDDDGNINEYEYVWPDNAFGTPSDTNAVPSYTSVLMTDKDGGYKFSNFVAGDYVVRFEYGNTALTMKYNGQDYKNTAYQTNIKNPTKEEITDKYKEVTEVGEEIIHYEKMNNDQYVDGSGINEELADQITVNNEWHDLTDLTKNLNTERVSDARDYEARRLDVIKNSRTISNRIAEILALADSDEAEELITKVKEKMNTENITYGEALIKIKDEPGNEKLKELVDSDEYKALIELNSMEANTAKLNVEVETAGKVEYGKSKKSVNGTFTVTTGGSYEKIKETWTNDEENSKKEYNIKNIDFGIERRANTIIQLDKYVEQIDITKQNEKVFSVGVNEDGTLKTEDAIRLDKVISVSESDGVQGFKYINMEDSYLQNSTVAIKYKIRVTNKSEADFASEELVKTYTADKIKEKVDSIYEADSTKSGENIKYGQYVGLYYYTHDKQAVGEEKHIASADYKDANVKTRVDRLVEYIDPNSSGLDEATTNSEDSAWETSLPTDVADVDKDADGNAVVKGERIKALKGLISDESYTNTAEEGKDDEYYLADDDGRIYITETRNLVEFSHSDKLVEKVIETNRLDRGNKGEGQLTYEDAENPMEKKYITVPVGTLTVKEVFKVNDVFVYDNNNGDDYVTDAFDKKLTQELDTIALTDDKVKDDEDAIIHVTIKNDVANDISLENMIYYNLAEVLVYSNSVGRRSMNAIPGNAFEYAKQEVKQDDDRMMYASGIWEAAHSSNMNTNDEIKDKIKNEIPADKDTNNLKKTMKYAINTNKAMNEYNKNENGYTVYTIAELDADSTDFVTFTEPTGLSQAVQQQNIIIIALLIALVLLAVGIIAITVRVVLRKSTDDIVIESTKEE